MTSEELDHFVIRQLQLGDTTAITYRNMPHTITDKQRDINSLRGSHALLNSPTDRIPSQPSAALPGGVHRRAPCMKQRIARGSDGRGELRRAWEPRREAYSRKDAKKGARAEWGNGGISEKKESSRMISESGGANPNAGNPSRNFLMRSLSRFEGPLTANSCRWPRCCPLLFHAYQIPK